MITLVPISDLRSQDPLYLGRSVCCFFVLRQQGWPQTQKVAENDIKPLSDLLTVTPSLYDSSDITQSFVCAIQVLCKHYYPRLIFWCAYICLHVYAYVHVGMWGSEVDSGCFSLVLFILFFEAGSLIGCRVH